jgi:hypothetical protein
LARTHRASWEDAVTQATPPGGTGATAPGTEDLFRHLDDLRTNSYEGAGPRAEREEVFRRATALLDPVVTAILEEADAAVLDGTGEVAREPAAGDGRGGQVARWSLSWPAQRDLGVDPVTVVAWFGATFTHGHLAGASLGHWPLQVTDAADAERQAPTVRAIVEAELHQRVFDASNWRVITGYARRHPGA